jgi:hypothetical protein
MTSEDSKKLFEFLRDDSATERLALDDFVQAIVAVAWNCYSQWWVSPAERLLVFLKKDFASVTKLLPKVK